MSATVLGLRLELVKRVLRKRLDRTIALNDLEVCETIKYFTGLKCRPSLEWHPNRPAILTVPSLNFVGFLHFIVWDG